jgi:DNA-binding NtrC family response regulator
MIRIMSKLSILVVEDDALARKVMAAHLKEHDLDFAEDAAAARRKIAAGRHDLCFIDLQLGEGDSRSGLELIPLAAAKGVYSVVMSGHDAEAIVEHAYDYGCDDFYSKGNEKSNIEAVFARYRLRKEGTKADVFTDRFVTIDPATRESVEEALKYAPSELPILILGPSGTGKTCLARVIHEHSGRPGAFVAINCAAYTEDLLEAELFGYRKGAFTGANDNHKGKLLLADQGTLFLDEVGAMSLKMQTKLLKAVEEHSFYPLGSDKSETSRFRVISATLEDMQSLIKAGLMRFDFFQRIHGLTVELKPLAQRKCDIFPLIASLGRGGKRLAFTAEAKQRLQTHDWPGNVRELRRFVELLAAGHDGRVTLDAADRLLKTARAGQASGGGFASEEQYRFALDRGVGALLDRLADEVIRRNLEENTGKKTKVLSDLKISTRLLYASLKRRDEAPRGGGAS